MPKKGGISNYYTLKVLLTFLRPYSLLIVGLISFTFLVELINFFDNFFFKYLVDSGSSYLQGILTSDVFTQLILSILALYFGSKLIETVFWYYMHVYLMKMESRVLSDIEQKSFWHVINLSYNFHLGKKTGSLISQFTRGINRVESLLDVVTWHFFPVFFRIIFSLSVLSYFDLRTGLILGLTTMLFIAVSIYFTHKQRIPQDKANEAEDRLKQNLSDVYLNIEAVKYFGKEKFSFSYFRSLSQRLKDDRYRFWMYFSYQSIFQVLILGIGLSAILYFSFMRLRDGILTLGTITLIYATVWKLVPFLFTFIHGYRDFMRSIVDVHDLFAIFKEQPEIKDQKDAKSLTVRDGDILFENVSFSYPRSRKSDESVLKNFTLHVKKNTKVALVGLSGSGKTTVVKLLYRLFDVNSGRILIDQQNISSITQQSLKENMSIVPQEPLLFDNTLYYNIAYANPSASTKEVWQAIKFAQLHNFIHKLPQKEKTLVGERGIRLSGGEKQRVSIARAILANKKILILDEATSALDSQTEKEIQHALENLMKNRTTIIIAHRLSTIMKADLIVVLSEGKIVEIGTHSELKDKANGLYKHLWDLQQEEKW